MKKQKKYYSIVAMAEDVLGKKFAKQLEAQINLRKAAQAKKAMKDGLALIKKTKTKREKA